LLSEDSLFYEFDYRRISNNYNVPLAPIVDVKLKSRNNIFGILVNEFGLIDTGADVTLVPMSIIAKLKLEPTEDVDYSLIPKSLSKHRLADDAYSLWLSFGDNHYFRMTVWGLKVEENLIIIGRDLLNIGFSVNFDGKNFKTTIWYGFDN
jgi:predicted aspartyl protease